MKILVDIGNSNISFVLFSGNNLDKPSKVFCCGSDIDKSVDGYVAFILNELKEAHYTVENIDLMLIASVVPDLTPKIIECGQKYIKCKTHNISFDDVKSKIDIKLDNPNEVGIDRLANVAAVLYGKIDVPAIVVDCGTAITFDVINSQKQYMGGAIASGINLSMNSLSEKTAKLPKINAIKPKYVIGRNTIDAMRSGVIFGAISMIEGMIYRIEQEYGKKMYRIITGGQAVELANMSDIFDKVDPYLTLKGMYEIYNDNK